MTLCILSGSFFAYRMACKRYLPIKELLDQINVDYLLDNDNEFISIKKHLIKLTQENELSNKKAEKRIIAAKNATLSGIVKGRIRNINLDLEYDMADIGLTTNYPTYVLVCFEIEELGDFIIKQEDLIVKIIDSLYTLIRYTVEEKYGEIYSSATGEVDGLFVCLLNIIENNDDNMSEMKRIAVEICQYFHETYRITLTANISSGIIGKHNLSQAYDEVNLFIDYRDNIGTDKSVITFAEYENGEYLLNTDLYKSKQYIKMLLEKHRYKEAKDAFDRIMVFNKNITKPNNKKNTNIPESIVLIYRFIEANYMDSNLSVSQIANEFDVNLSFLSRIFKKETGEGMLDYINNVRIAEAKKYLNQGFSVRDTSQAVGYFTPRSFLRAFYKITGIKPSEFKDQ